jgi:hypothetical protein
MECTSRSLEIVSKETLCRDDSQVEELMEPEEECEASDKDDWQIDMPDGDEIDDVEETSVNDDSPPPRNRQRLSYLRGISMRTRCNFYAIV